MYIRSIKRAHFELTNRCNASCPSCLRTGPNTKRQISNHMVNAGWHDITLQEVKKIHKHLPKLEKVQLCGNFGDPAAARDFVKIVHYFVDNNVEVEISTNGGLRNPKLWASMARKGVVVLFAIDGDEDTNHIYRVGTKFNRIMENANAFINAGGIANWIFIPFAHNEHVINKCEKLANDMGFSSFEVKKTYRVGNNNPGYGPEIKLPSKKYMNKVVHKTTESSIRCKVKETDEIYIAADGDISPCCWIGCQLWIKKYSPNIAEYKSALASYYIDFDHNFKTNNLTNIINSYVQRGEMYELSWDYRKIPVCNKNCGNNKWLDRYLK